MGTPTTTHARLTARLTVAAALALSLAACGASGDEPGTVTPAQDPAPASTAEDAADAPAEPSSAPDDTEATAPAADTTDEDSQDAASATDAGAQDAVEATDPDADAEPADDQTGGQAADEPISDADVSAEAAEGGRSETLDADGGIIVDGTTVTFVYVNGVQFSADLGAPIGAPPFNYSDAEHTLTLSADGNGMLVTGAAVTTIASDGSGSISEPAGLIAIAPDGSASCATDDTLSWVNADGTGGSAGTHGLLIVDESGDLQVGTPPSPEDAVGRFAACNVEASTKVDVSADVLFEFGQADLTAQGQSVIEGVASTLTANDAATVTVTGHTDWIGTTDFNQDLGQRRADAVAELLGQKAPELEISTDSAGESLPVAANANPDGSDNPVGRALNRRVEIVFRAP